LHLHYLKFDSLKEKKKKKKKKKKEKKAQPNSKHIRVPSFENREKNGY
jgi:hypothetical protein